MISGIVKCSVFIATSLDGFISRTDGSIDWLDEANTRVPKGEDCGYGQFMSTIDALVMGRHTFELAKSFGEWPYGKTPVFVLSSRMTSLPGDVPNTVRLSSEEPATLIAQLSARNMRHLYIDGGVTIQRFLARGLIDEITITRVPTLIGSGRPLFGPLSQDIRLEHISTRAFDFGFVQSKYRVVKTANPLMQPTGRKRPAAD
jgi:dihydrofolate reductase